MNEREKDLKWIVNKMIWMSDEEIEKLPDEAFIPLIWKEPEKVDLKSEKTKEIIKELRKLEPKSIRSIALICLIDESML